MRVVEVASCQNIWVHGLPGMEMSPAYRITAERWLFRRTRRFYGACFSGAAGQLPDHWLEQKGRRTKPVPVGSELHRTLTNALIEHSLQRKVVIL